MEGAPTDGRPSVKGPLKMAAKTAKEKRELKKVQEEYVKVIGPLPGGQWGSNVPHLKKKIAR